MATFVQYQLKSPLATSTYGGGLIRVAEGRTLNVGAALAAGGGTITADQTDTNLISALDDYWALRRVGTTTVGPATTVSYTLPLVATLTDPQPGDTLQLSNDLRSAINVPSGVGGIGAGGNSGRTDTSIGSLGTGKTLTLTSDDDQSVVDVPLTLTAGTSTAPAVLTIAGRNLVARCKIWITATQDGTGGRVFAVKDATSGQSTTITGVDTTANTAVLVIAYTIDGATLQIAAPTPIAAGVMPTITGTVGVGNVLTAHPPVGLTSITYQWTRDGVDIGGATSATYTQVTADIGHSIRVRTAGTPSATSDPVTIRATVATIPDVSTMAHRMGGANTWNENALSAYQFMADAGHVLCDGGDLQKTSDGFAVNMHDTTVDRTTSGTGSVVSKTLAQMQALTIDQLAPGYPATDHPSSLPDILNEAKRLGLVITTEIKATGIAQQVADAIVLAGMQDSVVVGSFNDTEIAPAKAAGIRVGGNTADVAPALAAGYYYIAYDYTDTATFTAAKLQALYDAGIKLSPFTMFRRYELSNEQTRVGRPLWMIVSNEPLYINSTNPVLTASTFDITGRYDHGMIARDGAASRSSIAVDGSGVYWLRMWSTSSSGEAMLMGFLAGSTALGLQATFRVDTKSATLGDHFGVMFGATDDRTAQASGTPAGSYYLGFQRMDGSLRLSRVDNGVFTTIGTSVAAPALNNGDLVTLKGEILAGNNIKVTRVETGHSVTSTATDTTYRGGYRHLEKAHSSPFVLQVSASAVKAV